MRTTDREQLIPLPHAWYYLNTVDHDTAEVYQVDPEHSDLGSIIRSARMAVIDDTAPIVVKTRA